MDVDAFHDNYDHHPDDRIRLFGAVADYLGNGAVLYPGSYVDIAPSVYFDDVMYVDTDRRAARFFAQTGPVAQLIDRKRGAAGCPPLGSAGVRFHQADYNEPLPLADASVQLLVSLYAGFVSAHCSRYLASGGWLLANNSHGDASMASLDPANALVAVVTSRDGGYRVRSKDLDGYLTPRKGTAPDAEELHRTKRGIAFRRPAFAYLFQRD